jgi:hypothetical protein
MTSRRKATATSFKRGQSGNVKGRPPGIKETRPRGYLRAAIDTVMTADPKKLTTAIRRGLEDPRYAHAFAELIGKVTKEIGGSAAEDTRPVVFHFHTNLNPMALAGRQSPMRRIIDGESSRGVGAPGLPAQAEGRRRPSEDR